MDVGISCLPEPRGIRITRSMKAGIFSMLFHLLAVIGLSLLVLPESTQTTLSVLSGTYERPEEFRTEELGMLPETEIDSIDSPLAAQVPDTTPAKISEVVEVESPLDIPMGPPSLTIETPTQQGQASQFLETLSYGTGGRGSQAVQGQQQAVEQITEELSWILSDHKVLLIWCFDQSYSMVPSRNDIRRRIHKIYTELGLTSPDDGDALLTSVCSFGPEFTVHTTEPTSDLNRIEAAIDAVPKDTTGIEKMCQAVSQAAGFHQRYATDQISRIVSEEPATPDTNSSSVTHTGADMVVIQRKMVLILVTDESGDREENQNYLEKTIADVKQAECRVYVLGREASFGHPTATIRLTHPEANVTRTFKIDRGPETADFEVLQTNGLGPRTDIIGSCFGPYEQARLARETGGVFFMLPDKKISAKEAEQRRAELNQMRHYLPDLDSRTQYVRNLGLSRLRRTVLETVERFDPVSKENPGVLRPLRILPMEPKKFTASVSASVTKSQALASQYDTCIALLDQLKSDRQEEQNRRWQANYDLILAQMLAYRAQTNEYLACLDPYTVLPPVPENVHGPDKKTNYWKINNIKKLSTPKKTKADADRSAQLFADIIEQHPNTPWAKRAAWELRRPHGYELAEGYRPPPKPKPPKKPAPKPKPDTPPKPKPKPKAKLVWPTP